MRLNATSRWQAVAALPFMVASMLPLATFAGTTGAIAGRVVDSQTQVPLADVKVTASSASQIATSTTDASGSFRFLSLAPDTYTLDFTKAGYDELSDPGVVVFADQMQTLAVRLDKALKTIARVTSRSAGSLVKSGTGSDVYSVNSTMASAAAGLTGAGSLSNAYGAIASVPGVTMDPTQQGWWQMVHIRGGDIDQVGYELDGIPVNRVYDNAPMTMLTSLGQQELQIYTGGTPASADAQGISGYINQVVKTGTYPGFGTADLSMGAPAFYHGASVEAGGSAPDRRFSWYAGFGGADQDYRFVNNANGAGDQSWFFYPVNLVDPTTFSPGPAGVYVGGEPAGAPLFSSGTLYGFASTAQRDSVVNFHFGIPHGNGLRDDLQLLYVNSEVFADYYSSQNDVSPKIANYLGQNLWDDSYSYNGPVGQAPSAADVGTLYFPYSPAHAFQSALPSSLRDSNDNGVGVTKLQYQHSFSPSSFLRVYGYTLYSNWYIYGPNTAAQPYYGAELAVYQIPDHTFGGNISYTNQLSDRHLLNISYGYTGSNLQRYDIGFIPSNYGVASYTNGSQCFDPSSGAQVGCIWQSQQLTAGESNDGSIQAVGGLNGHALFPGAVPGASWLVTNNQYYNNPTGTPSGQALNQVHTRFSGLSIGDEWRPSDPLDLNIGMRIENFEYIYGPTGAADPTRQFWFNAYNNEYCWLGTGVAPQPLVNQTTGEFSSGTGTAGCQALYGSTAQLLGSSKFALSNPGDVPNYVVARFQPRFSFTYTLNPDTVLRGSAGVYARPPNSSWVQYNLVQEDLPIYLGNHFSAFGFTTPQHTIRPDTSYNYDISLEHHFRGTDVAFKLTPFYRSTRDQLQNFFIDPAGGLESGLNVGHQVSQGVELAISKGDFNRNGFAAQLAYTYTHSAIRYQDFPGMNVNVIDQLNTYIQHYNSFTYQCAKNENTAQCGNGQFASNGVASFAAGTNPYYCPTVSPACPYQAQPLLDRNAWYPTYDVVPGPTAGLNGYWVPHTVSLLLNYRRDKFAITPAVQWQSGAEYGAPTAWPGYDPSSCTGSLTNGNVDPATCSGELFIPDPYNHYHYDTLGQYKQPWVLTGSLGLSYDFSPRIRARISFVDLVDTCGQRGYAWDNSQICTYGALGASLMAPEGNFYPNSLLTTAPVQMKYPYGVFLNNNNTGFLGTTQPLQILGTLQIKM
jgi:hypothetical protein